MAVIPKNCNQCGKHSALCVCGRPKEMHHQFDGMVELVPTDIGFPDEMKFKDVDMIVSNLHMWYRETEERLISSVLKAYLNRLPEIEDWKQCVKVTGWDDPSTYLLRFNNVPLGWVKSHYPFENGNRYRMTFKPI